MTKAWTSQDTVLPNGQRGVYLKGSGAERPVPSSLQTA
jgi:hypothetical protein